MDDCVAPGRASAAKNRSEHISVSRAVLLPSVSGAVVIILNMEKYRN